jgi:hypothetical protein
MHPFHIIGLLVCVVALSKACWKLVAQRRWMKARGKVITLGPERAGESPDQPILGMYSPVIKFLTEKKELICEKVYGFQFGPASAGDSVSVLYDPESPTHFCSVTLHRRFHIEAALVFLGIFIVFIAQA